MIKVIDTKQSIQEAAEYFANNVLNGVASSFDFTAISKPRQQEVFHDIEEAKQILLKKAGK